ncbi:O-methyltransferase [Frateuria aurantia]
MATLTTSPLADVLERLHHQDEAPAEAPALAGLSPEQRHALMRDKHRYIELYTQLKDLALAVSRETGRLLYALARGSQARSIVEFGTSLGLSTLYLAAALRDNGGGRLLSSEFEPSKIARARQHLAEAGVADLVEIREGDALQTLARDLPPCIDLVLLDGAKALYPDILARLQPHPRPGALILADDADRNPDYLAVVRDRTRGYLSTPVGADVELSIWMG